MTGLNNSLIQNQVIHADCFNVFKTMHDNSVNLTVTDIPYNQINSKSNGRDKYKGQLRKLNKGIADSSEVNITKLVTELVRITTGSIYIFCEWEQLSDIVRLFRMNGLSTRVLEWNKTNPSVMNGKKVWLSSNELFVYGKFSNATFNGNCKKSSLEYPTVHWSKRVHPTEKPVNLLAELIKTSSNEGDLVLDCCAGSGSLGSACIQTNRNYCCIEKDKEFFKIIKNRLVSQTTFENTLHSKSTRD